MKKMRVKIFRELVTKVIKKLKNLFGYYIKAKEIEYSKLISLLIALSSFNYYDYDTYPKAYFIVSFGDC
jgi:hypothetical protein